jgi:hypothetical protein
MLNIHTFIKHQLGKIVRLRIEQWTSEWYHLNGSKTSQSSEKDLIGIQGGDALPSRRFLLNITSSKSEL